MNRARGLVVLAFACVSVVFAYWWGDYLMGPGCGVLYVVLALCLVWLIVWCLVLAKKPSWWRDVPVAALSLRVTFGMACPTLVQPDCRGLIDDRATERTIYAELHTMLSSDPAFRDLPFSIERVPSYGLIFQCEIKGTLRNGAELDWLHDRLAQEAPLLGKHTYVRWDIKFPLSGMVVGPDYQHFPTRIGLGS